MPDLPDDALSLSSLFSGAAAAVIRIQQALDDPANPNSGVYVLNNIQASLRFGLVASKSKKILFIPQGRVDTRQHHQVSFRLSPVPAPPAPLAPLESAGPDALPLELVEPSFIVEQEEERALVDRLTTALALGQWRASMDDPSKLKQKAVDEAVRRIQEAADAPGDSDPQLGVVAFRVTEDPPSWLIVHLTDDTDNDGVFLLPDGESPTAEIFTIGGDRNDRIRYLPFQLTALAVRRWLKGGEPRRSHLPMGLPRRWGITTLDGFARAMFDGYRECRSLLSAQPEQVALPVCFHLHSIAAEVSMTVSFDADQPRFSITDPPTGAELIHGRVGVQVEPGGDGARLVLTLLAPGFVLTPSARDAFTALAGQSAADIAREFDQSTRAAYVEALQHPPDPENVVVFVTAEKGGSKLRLLATWPGAFAGEPRDFVFTCKQDGDHLSDFNAVVGMQDKMSTVVIDAPQTGAGGLSEDQYKQFGRFFRAVRVWRAGFSV